MDSSLIYAIAATVIAAAGLFCSFTAVAAWSGAKQCLEAFEKRLLLLERTVDDESAASKEGYELCRDRLSLLKSTRESLAYTDKLSGQRFQKYDHKIEKLNARQLHILERMQKYENLPDQLESVRKKTHETYRGIAELHGRLAALSKGGNNG
jgi:DNA repair exonuclease SbcCD ATPase subunit